MAITFDDGPDPTYTPQVLDLMSDAGAIGTFFLVGQQVRAHPDIVERIAAEGHAIGSHSDTHPEPWKLAAPALARDYRRGRQAVEQIVGRQVPLFRPPNGHYDLRGAMAMRAARARPWLWTLDPRDWVPGTRADDLVSRLHSVEDGDVVLLHDGMMNPRSPEALDRSATVAALRALLDSLHERGLATSSLTSA